MICPIRKGGECVEKGCAWYFEDECSILSIARSLNKTEDDGFPIFNSLSSISDDDVPF